MVPELPTQGFAALWIGTGWCCPALGGTGYVLHEDFVGLGLHGLAQAAGSALQKAVQHAGMLSPNTQ